MMIELELADVVDGIICSTTVGLAIAVVENKGEECMISHLHAHIHVHVF